MYKENTHFQVLIEIVNEVIKRAEENRITDETKYRVVNERECD